MIAGLAWAGSALDEAPIGSGGPRISAGSGPTAWVIPTNEELVIARQMRSVLGAAQAARILNMEDDVMETKTKPGATEQELGDETFMSAICGPT